METIQSIVNWFISLFEPLRHTFLWPGLAEIGKFIGEHLTSAMLPAFLVAGAISIFIDKQRIVKYMGPEANPTIAYPAAALSGGILTVCSCGVIPIFTSVMSQGAGIGPAFTFLVAAPAVNIMALSYTQSLISNEFLIGRIAVVFCSSILIGLCMRAIFGKGDIEKPPEDIIIMPEEDHTDGEIISFFALLILLMLTATGLFDKYIYSLFLSLFSNSVPSIFACRLYTIFLEIFVIAFFCKKKFTFGETRIWLWKSFSLFKMIFPKVLLGVFVCGLISGNVNLTEYLDHFSANDFKGNLLASVVGALMYFGTIVGVTIVATLKNFGMNAGPAMTLLLAGPAISLPSVVAMMPVAGKKRSLVFLTLVICFSALSGYIFGSCVK